VLTQLKQKKIMSEKKGIVYLIQPCELLKTNRFKIGYSRDGDNLTRLVNGYKNGSRYICILECENPLDVEKVIISEFSKRFKIIAGKEYFEGKESELQKLFMDIVHDKKFKINGIITNKEKTKNEYSKKIDETYITNSFLEWFSNHSKKTSDKLSYLLVNDIYDKLILSDFFHKLNANEKKYFNKSKITNILKNDEKYKSFFHDRKGLNGKRLRNVLLNYEFYNFKKEENNTEYPKNEDNKELEKINKEEINKEEINKEEINKEEINKEKINKEEINKEEINKKEINKEEINKEEINKECLENEDIYKSIGIKLTNDYEYDSVLNYRTGQKVLKVSSLEKGIFEDINMDSYKKCLNIVKQNGKLLEFIPKHYKDYKLCNEAVKENDLSKKFIPESIKNENSKVVNNDEFTKINNDKSNKKGNPNFLFGFMKLSSNGKRN
jgi:hypothetical protein